MTDMSPTAIAQRIVANEEMARTAFGYVRARAAELAVDLNWEGAHDLGIYAEVQAEYLRLKREG